MTLSEDLLWNDAKDVEHIFSYCGDLCGEKLDQRFCLKIFMDQIASCRALDYFGGVSRDTKRP